MLPFIAQYGDQFPAFFRQLAALWQPQSFTLAIWGINIGALLLAGVLSRHLAHPRTHWALSFLASIMLVNALSHIGQSLYLHALAPGVATAVLLILPSALSLLVMEHRYGLINAKTQWILLLMALPVMLLLIFILIFLANAMSALF